MFIDLNYIKTYKRILGCRECIVCEERNEKSKVMKSMEYVRERKTDAVKDGWYGGKRDEVQEEKDIKKWVVTD